VQIAEAVHSSTDAGPVTHYPTPASRAEYSNLLESLGDVVDRMGGEGFDDAVTRTQRLLEVLDERVTTDPGEPPGAARGLSGMLLPARQALDALTGS
jgi:hypothetical protein